MPRSGSKKSNGTKRKRAASKSLLVVGIGASAGGFEAISEFLKEIPTQTGMSFVFVQHLDPTHESQLPELLGRVSRLPVVAIKDGMVVEPNRVYVIPQNRVLQIEKGRLRLGVSRKARPQFVIDEFFQTLAQDQGNRAVGILLSGTGHDGMVGLEAIKAEGGLTFVQDQKTAKYFDMPANALKAGGVDFALSPSEIARELGRLSEHASVSKYLATADGAASMQDADKVLLRIFSLLRTVSGVDFSLYKLTTLQRRITRRMLLKRAAGLKDYLSFLEKNPQEIDLLFHDLLINVTSFFRDSNVFEALRKRVFPKILKQKPADAPIRVWVPGCSTGEEVYSLAICLHEFLMNNSRNRPIQIFGTDVSEALVSKARLGIYPKNISAHISAERLRRYFSKADGGWQIAKFIRDVCIFAKQNVVEDPPFSKLDLISCRNLLIYLGPTLQRKVFPIFHYSLRLGGFLLLGTSETIGGFSNLFSLIDKKHKIYSRLEAYSKLDLEHAPQPMVEPPQFGRRQKAKVEPVHIPFDYQKKADEILLSEYAPAGAVVNSRLEVLQFRGRTGPFLEPKGPASLNLLKLVRDELALAVRTAFNKAARGNLHARQEPVRIRLHNGHFREVVVEAVPLTLRPAVERYFLILFHDETGPDVNASVIDRRKPSTRQLRDAEAEIRRLRDDLAQTKESLQAIIEEQEATNEELKSANEEIQSSNEELQSTNEELETAKEELQSTNEELTTLNEELQSRNVELSQVNNDLSNLIASSNMPILMLDSDLRVRRFTPLAERLFNLIPTDIGRRITDINPNITVPNLNLLVNEVIETLNMREVEVQDRERHWYSLRIRPYRTSENRIEGAVLVVLDIGDVREGLEELADMVPDPLLVVARDLRVSKANEAFHKYFQLSPEMTEGTFLPELFQKWNVTELLVALEQFVSDNKRVENFRVERDFPKIGRRALVINVRKLHYRSMGTRYFLIRFSENS